MVASCPITIVLEMYRRKWQGGNIFSQKTMKEDFLNNFSMYLYFHIYFYFLQTWRFHIRYWFSSATEHCRILKKKKNHWNEFWNEYFQRVGHIFLRIISKKNLKNPWSIYVHTLKSASIFWTIFQKLLIFTMKHS